MQRRRRKTLRLSLLPCEFVRGLGCKVTQVGVDCAPVAILGRDPDHADLGARKDLLRELRRAIRLAEPAELSPVSAARAVGQVPCGGRKSTLRSTVVAAHLEQRGLSQPHAREIVSLFLTELGEHKFARIAHELKIPLAAVSAAWEFVKHKLLDAIVAACVVTCV